MKPPEQERLEELHRAMEYIVEMKSQEVYFDALTNGDDSTLQNIRDYLCAKKLEKNYRESTPAQQRDATPRKNS